MNWGKEQERERLRIFALGYAAAMQIVTETAAQLTVDDGSLFVPFGALFQNTDELAKEFLTKDQSENALFKSLPTHVYEEMERDYRGKGGLVDSVIAGTV